MYRCIIKEKVKNKINELCSKYPSQEWSGVLFYALIGDYNTSLDVICEDILMLDLGTSSFTEYSYSPEVANYLAYNPELLNCDFGCIHSHHKLPSFFSKVDLNTLYKEAFSTKEFVSLIVNNSGNYVAKLARKLKYKERTRKVTNNKKVYTESLIEEIQTIDLEIYSNNSK